MTPTRRQKRAWRRRVSRALHSRNQARGVTYGVDGDTIFPLILEARGQRRREIAPPWER